MLEEGSGESVHQHTSNYMEIYVLEIKSNDNLPVSANKLYIYKMSRLTE